jgi:hypothetical protein
MAINFVRGDTAPQLKLTLKDSLLPDQALDLTNAVVRLHIRAVGSSTLSLTKTATILAPTTGVAYIDWVDGDLSMAAGSYEAEVEVYYTSTGLRQTVYDFISILVRGDIA